MAQPRIQNEPASQPVEEPEGILDAHLEDLQRLAQDMVDAGLAMTLEEAVAAISAEVKDDPDAQPLTAAQRRALRGPREPKAPRLRRDLFGSTNGLK